MTTRRKNLSYDKLARKFGRVTFASHLKAVIETDFENRTACARKLGISPQALNDYITSRRTPTPALAGRMAKKLGYSPVSFIELALSDSVNNAGYKYKVKLESA